MANTPFYARHGLRIDTGLSAFLGNSTANMTFTSIAWGVANSTGSVNAAPGSFTVTIGSNTATLTGTSLALGNSTVNGSFTALQISLANSTANLSITPAQFSYAVGGAVFVGNTTANTKIQYNTVFVGNSSANVSITPGSILINGSALTTGGWTSSNDGSGSGLDADLLDGLDSTAFARLGVAQTYTAARTVSVGTAATAADYLLLQPTDYATSKPRLILSKAATANVWTIGLFDGTNTNGTINVSSSTFHHNGSVVWTAANDGTGSGLDADLLDGYDSAAFGRLAGSPTFTTHLTVAYSAVTSVANNSGACQVEIQNGSSGAAVIGFHRVGVYAGYIGLDTDNVFKIGGWSFGNAAYKIWHEGNDGSGTGLDADTVDGVHASSFYQSGSSPTFDTVTATAYNTSSDQSLKDQITDLEASESKLRSILFRSFVMKNEPDRLRAGVIAQELEPILPHLVITGDDGIKSVDYVGLSIYFMKYVQDLDWRLTVLESKIDSMTG